MCGISGYVGEKLGVPIVLDCLQRLEYRGYDSAGIAYVDKNEFQVVKKVGKLKNLSNFLQNKIIPASCAIGHTRWATHGEPTTQNAHPHQDCSKLLALVHNGIIENFAQLKEKLRNESVKFVSQTDTEVIAQLLAKEIQSGTSKKQNLNKTTILKAIKSIIKKLDGAYACAFVVKGLDDYIFYFKKQSPLILGKGNNENFLASDVSAMLPYTNKIYHLKDNEFGYISKNEVCVFDKNGKSIEPKFEIIDLKLEQIMLGNFKHYMHKEIEQGAESVLNTLDKLKDVWHKNIPQGIFDKEFNLHITACGTALHAGRVAKYLIENQLRIAVDLDYASEFRYKTPLLDEKSICIFISQSGETADTLGCLELAKSKGATTIAITNVPASRMQTLADFVIPTFAGPEIAVASTKAYLAQLAVIYGFVEYLANLMNKKIAFNTEYIKTKIKENNKIDYISQLKSIVQEIKDEASIYFVGRGLDYLIAMESALKLKEITYIHCESLPAGELKHGSLALINVNSVVVAILTQSSLIDKMLNNIHELNSRGAKVYLFTPFEDMEQYVYKVVKLPKVNDITAPLFAIKPLQLLAYMTAITKGFDPDKPRNLAKSVTVE